MAESVSHMTEPLLRQVPWCSNRDGSHLQRGEVRRPRCSLHLWANCGEDLGHF